MSEDGAPDMGFCGAAEAYFVVETPDGDLLHVELLACGLGRRLRPLTGVSYTRPAEQGLYLRFKCAGDGRARGYFFARYVVDKEGRRGEHAWAVSYTDHDGKARESKFRGTLLIYKEREDAPNKWKFFGAIKVATPP